MSKEQGKSTISIGVINDFKYLEINKVKYFLGDFISLKNNNNTKFRLDDILSENRIKCSWGTSNRNYDVFQTIDLVGFYYKRDQKKYGVQKNSRVYENDLDSETHDSFGNVGTLRNMIQYDGKLILKNLCTKCYYSNKENDNIWIPNSKLGNGFIGWRTCDITGNLYISHFVKSSYKANLTNMHVDTVMINLDIYQNSTTTSYRVLRKLGFDIQESSKSITVINAQELLEKYPDLLIIGPRSGMLILKSEINRDGYKKYDTGYYFPEFKNIQKFKPGNTAHNYRYGLDSSTHLITEGLKYTFGVEIEMADCVFTNSLMKDFNIFVEKDGSIRNTRGEKYGPEVVTGVLKGDKGFEHLQALCNELARNGEVNATTGIHVHIGGADFNNNNIVMLFKLLKLVETEVFNMLPRSRRNNEYCRKLPEFDFNFENCISLMDLKIRVNNYYTELFTKAANTPPNDKFNKNVNHPKGAKVGYDHNNIRYCWVNFIPALFNTRESSPPSYTIEFRAFNGSTNFTKIKNWVKICMALVNFAENCHSDIMSNSVTLNDGSVCPLTLKNVIQKIYPKSYRKLNEFIDTRTELFRGNDKEDTIDEQKEEVNLKLKELI